MAATDKLFTWSVSARSDFQSVVDDGQCSERFKLALATTIANGWDSNRDKPGWALAGLCPGPAMASLFYGGANGAVFLLAMLVGMLGWSGLSRRTVQSVN